MTRIETLVQEGMGVDGIYGLSAVQIAEDRNEKPYLKGKIVDTTGEVPIRMFSDSQTEHLKWQELQQGQMVGIKGTLESFKGWMHVKIAALDEDPPITSDISVTPRVTDEALGYAREAIETAFTNPNNPQVENLHGVFLEWFDEEFWESPGFSDCHQFLGSLATHTGDMILALNDLSDPFYGDEQLELLRSAALVYNLWCIPRWDTTGLAPVLTPTGELSSPLGTAMQIVSSLCTEAVIEGGFRMVLEDCVASALDKSHSPRTEEGHIFRSVHELVTNLSRYAHFSKHADDAGLFHMGDRTRFRYSYPTEEGWGSGDNSASES